MPRNQFSFEWLCALTIPGTTSKREQSIRSASSGALDASRPPSTTTSSRRNSPPPVSTSPPSRISRTMRTLRPTDALPYVLPRAENQPGSPVCSHLGGSMEQAARNDLAEIQFDGHGIEPIPEGDRDSTPLRQFWIWAGANIAPINWILGALGIILGLSL